MKNKPKSKYNVLSPDGFTIHRDREYPSKRAAHKAAKEWTRNYTHQGYYSSVRFGRIPVNEIIDYCKLITVK